MSDGGTDGVGSRSGGRGRALRWASMVGAVAVALVFVGSSAAAPLSTTRASPPTRAPFSGTEFGIFTGESSGCGVASTFPVLPFFNLTTGVANGSVKATARSCGSTNSTVFSFEIDEFESAAFRVPSTGTYQLKASWVLSFATTLKATSGAVSEYAAAEFIVTATVEVLNVSSGAYTYGTDSSETHSITTGTYTHTYVKLHTSAFLNLTLDKADQYNVLTFVEITALADTTPGTSSASALVNMGSSGKDAILTSISGA